jgi:phage repressor protein C with HTH and peptisase S24 domain
LPILYYRHVLLILSSILFKEIANYLLFGGEGWKKVMERGLCEKFTEIRKEQALNKQQFADFLEIPSTTVSDIELGKREPSKDVLLKLTTKCGVNLHWMLTGDGNKYIKKPIAEHGSEKLPVYKKSEIPEGSFIVPFLDQRLSAGSGSYLPEDDDIKALVHIPAYLSRFGKNIAALTVDGDSMYPTLSRGDMIVCDSCGWSGEGIYALRMSGEGFVKRLTKRPGKLVIISDNPKYPPQEEPEGSEDIQIIGRVHCAIKELE